LKEVRRARIRQEATTSSSASLRTDGNDADTEENSPISQSPSYGTIRQNKAQLRQRSPQGSRSRSHETREHADATSNGPSTNGTPSHVPMVDTQQPTISSDDSSTPIIPQAKLRARKTMTSKPSSSHLNIRTIFDSFRRSRHRTIDGLDTVSLAKVHEADFDETELNFIDWLDDEINKINEFYQDKENEAEERYKQLSAQLEALQRLREATRLRESNETSESASPGNGAEARPRFKSIWVQQPINRLRASMDGLSSAMPGADHQRRAKEPDLMPHPIGDVENPSTAIGYVEYRVARRRLKQALLEFYRAMELLKGYRLMNRTGLAKILKKFDKTAGRQISPEYTEKLKKVHFDQSEALETIMYHTEVTLLERHG
jgi:xenotropic and polytropic retrovirus receptor 1